MDAPTLTPRLMRALNAAAVHHRDHVRKGSGIPYVAHLYAVMHLVARFTDDEDVLIAALFHDTLEDVPERYSEAEMRGDWGDCVTDLVLHVSKDDSLAGWRARAEAYLDHLENQAPDEALLIACADKLHNLMSIFDDYAVQGEALWERFNSGRQQQWWYGRAHAVVEKRMPGLPLNAELARLVERFPAPSTLAGKISLMSLVPGNTPLVRLDRLSTSPDVTLWAKLEGHNPSGSAKDRTAHAILQAAGLQPGAIIVESSSGNLGVAMAREAVLGDWTFHCVVDPKANGPTVATMRAYGAVVHEVTEPDPVTGDWLAARRARVAELLDEIPGAVCLDQYSNRAAFTAHDEGTMREIVEQLGRAPDHLLVAVSTTGTIGGCLRRIVREGMPTEVTAVDAEGSVLFDGARGRRLLPGYGAGVVPDLAAEVVPDRVMRIADCESVSAARRLARKEGILCGASGGAVIAAVEKRLPELHGDVVVVLHDGGTNYLGTIYNDDWVEETL